MLRRPRVTRLSLLILVLVLLATLAVVANRVAAGRYGGGAQTPDPAAPPLADNATAHYHLDELSGITARDSSPNRHDAQYVGHVVFGVPGVSSARTDTAVTVAGDSGYVAIPEPKPMSGSADRTVEFWFRTTQTNNINLLHGGSSGPGHGFDLGLTGLNGPGGPGSHSASGFYARFGNDDIHLPGLVLADGSWHYVAVGVSKGGKQVSIVIDGRQPQGYVGNGTNYATDTVSQPFQMPVPLNTTPGTLGLGRGGWAPGYSGDVDEIAIYPTALSLTETQNHFSRASNSR